MITTTVTDFFYRHASDPQRPIDKTLLWVFSFVVERSLASLGGHLASLSSDAKRRMATSKRRQAMLDKKGKTSQDGFGLLRFSFVKLLISRLIVNSYLHFIVYPSTIRLKCVKSKKRKPATSI